MRKTTERIDCTGYSIVADWYVADHAKRSMLLIPGYQSKRVRQSEFASKVALKGVNVLAIDYSGHGDSPFELQDTRPAQHLLETVCAFDWLRGTVAEGSIAVMGTSYGGFQAAHLSRFRDFSKLVLKTPALYRPEDMYTLSGQLDRKEAAAVYRKDVESVASHPVFQLPRVFRGDTLVVVHSEDEDIPVVTTDQYIRSFNADTYIAEGFRHWTRDPTNPPDMLEEYHEAMAKWISA